jgi:hypothetical protein
MLEVKNIFTGENVEFKNSTELKEFLKMQNPTIMKQYKQELESKADIRIVGIGSDVKVLKK